MLPILLAPGKKNQIQIQNAIFILLRFKPLSLANIYPCTLTDMKFSSSAQKYIIPTKWY